MKTILGFELFECVAFITVSALNLRSEILTEKNPGIGGFRLHRKQTDECT
jgi:hypothetical protein